MNVTDPVADLLTNIRNGSQAKHDVVTIPASKLKIAIVHILREEGFVRNYKCVRDGRQGLLKIALKYDGHGDPIIREIKRVSKSSRRIYKKANELPFVKNGYGIGIFSTPRGVMSDRDARKNHIGGEYLCSVF